jgi:2-polyprenyl-3-methyl-5-hydroxy-6-metoxy-1,4-benzoquinol methylase
MLMFAATEDDFSVSRCVGGAGFVARRILHFEMTKIFWIFDDVMLILLWCVVSTFTAPFEYLKARIRRRCALPRPFSHSPSRQTTVRSATNNTMEGKDECSNLLPASQEGYVQSLESRLLERSNRLEEKHMEAAIDAELINAPCCVATAVSRQNKNTDDNEEPNDSNTSTPDDDGDDNHEKKKTPIFDDYTNPDSVQNCLSPYVPTSAARIAALVQFVKLQKHDVFLDIGCGDGRVCIAASQLTATTTTTVGGGCRAIGLDVSPLCIQMAQQVALEEGLADHVEFYQTDATVDPHVLLSGNGNGEILHVNEKLQKRNASIRVVAV